MTTKPDLKHIFLFVINAKGLLQVRVVLKLTKGFVKVSHGYFKVEWVKPGPLGNMTLSPRGESSNRTRPGLDWPDNTKQTLI